MNELSGGCETTGASSVFGLVPYVPEEKVSHTDTGLSRLNWDTTQRLESQWGILIISIFVTPASITIIDGGKAYSDLSDECTNTEVCPSGGCRNCNCQFNPIMS